MDESLFIMMLLCGFLLFFAIIYCFLSTCLGIQIRRSDLWDALRPPSLADIRARDATRRRRAEQSARLGLDDGHDGYEMGDMGIGGGGGFGGAGLGRAGMGGGIEELEMMRRGGPGRFY